ncbi:MAG: TIGR01777 family protein [Gemmatimonadetes bacterium]|nr:TIGR01777 family protein [Gemmatimonadota bacterium]
MPRFRYETRLPFPTDEVFAWHARPGAFERLAPPWTTIRVRERKGTIRDGDEVGLEFERGPLRFIWRFRHRDFAEGRGFTDEQVSGPFQRWVHEHRFEPDELGGTSVVDEIQWELPAVAVDALATPVVERELARVFAFRARRLRNDLSLHARWRGRSRLAVGLTGAGGLIGGALRHFLTAGGHRVVALVRDAERARREDGSIYWNPERGEIAPDALAGLDAVVHLAGEPIVQLPRWTAEKKKRILESRVRGTELIARAVATQHDRGPRVLLSGSAVGYYGNRKDEVLTEDSGSGKGFLAEVTSAWEDATRRARGSGVRVALLRLGPVLTPAGGMLKKVLIPFRMGMGGRVGSGHQYVSWVDSDDAMGIVLHALMAQLEGPINVCSPHPVPNATFADILGRVLERPTLVPVPALVVKAGLGEMGEESLLHSQRAKPERLLRSGYDFLFEGVEECLRFELGRAAPPGRPRKDEAR